MARMRCPRCQSESPPDAAFCPECGARLEIACPACGAANAPAHNFCKRCGQALATAALRPAGPHFVSPQAYMPRHLAEKILTSKSALEGERKQVTVLFADLKGSMELLADRDPEEARKLLDPVIERMMGAVHRYEGTVNQVLGDGIMALFGAPLAHEDHAIRACFAALAMQVATRRYTEEVRREHGLELQIRVGLNSGEVVVRSIGNDLHMDYSAIGQTTHLAARMEQLAIPGSIRLTVETLRLAEGFVQVTSLGLVPVKGLAEPVEMFELVGAAPTRTRLQAAAARGLTRFVGRDAELEALRQALEKARGGHGQVVALVGEPGVGKSRLFWEFTHSHRTERWLILESSSVSYGKATAYLPVIDLLKAYFQIEDRDDGRKIREKVTGKLLTLEKALEAALPAFLALFEVPVEDPEWRALDPPQRRQCTLDACKRLLLRESQVQPLCLVFEDLHWIDSETQAFLDSLIESLPTARILLLVNYRPEYRHGWGSKTYYAQLRVDPLPPESCEELLHALLGEDASLQPLKQLLMDRTEGNPFFLEESVRTLVETEVLVGERGAYRLAKPLQTIQVPATAQAVLAARIDRLPPEDKRLLQGASVIGKDVPLALLRAIAGLPEEELRGGLSRLQAAELLYETSLFPDLEYTFKHALTHEVAYGGLLHERRQALHGKLVEAIEALYADRLAEQVERLAHHAHRSGVWDKAAPYLRQAGAKAVARSADREAVACFELALEALSHLPESRDRFQQAIDLRFSLRASLFRLGEFERILDYLREAETLARAIDDQPRLGQVYSHLINYYLATGEHDRALEAGERALAIADDLKDVDLHRLANFHLGQVYASLGDYRRAIDSIRAFAQSLRGDPRQERFDQSARLVLSSTWLAWWLAELGEFVDGTAVGGEAVRLAEAVDQPFERLVAYLGVGLLALRKGDLHEAIAALEKSLPLCRVGDLALWFPAIASPLGYAYALSGRLAEAVPLLERAVEETVLLRRVGHALRIAHLSEAYLLAGRSDDARELAARALELSRNHRERGHQAYALRLLGEIAAQRDPPEGGQAEAYYREAIALAESLGMRPLLAHCHFGLGALYGRMGRLDQARWELSAAIHLFSSLEMTLWLGRAEAALVKSE
ncbi:MAG: AAA family ATPase [Candidatus Rokubacteria bacterium]|nr:AAA family ATPase [Candidatus Rokubacteria bacterium]